MIVLWMIPLSSPLDNNLINLTLIPTFPQNNPLTLTLLLTKRSSALMLNFPLSVSLCPIPHFPFLESS
jgi:hypothetical protein